jgi:thiamine monophosphate synthase
MSGVPAIALGGMDEKRGNDAVRAGFHGWAAIRAWSEVPLYGPKVTKVSGKATMQPLRSADSD